jgi:TolB-like protein
LGLRRLLLRTSPAAPQALEGLGLLSDDPAQDYFSDGITEDIITELSRFRALFVVARNSSFSLRGKAVDVTELGRRLGVRYVVEGSARKAGKWVQVTIQLVDTASGNHLWGERYDRTLPVCRRDFACSLGHNGGNNVSEQYDKYQEI